jgi:hypothetical protein
LFYEGLGYSSVARYKEAMLAFDRERTVNSQGAFPLVLFAITSADMGRMDEARAAVQVLKSTGTMQLFLSESFVSRLNADDRADAEKALVTLRELGLLQ